VRIPDEGGSSLCAARLRLGKPPQKLDDTEVIPPSFEARSFAGLGMARHRPPIRQALAD
jgi:hypothetical protein